MLRGHGNNGRDGPEGVRGGAHGTVIGTYMHGPLLPKNTGFADWLIATALGVDPARWRRSTTRWRPPRTGGRGGRRACDGRGRVSGGMHYRLVI